MSIIAQKWAYSQKLGNIYAKSVLAFLASHNFGNDQSCFRIKTIAGATDMSETSVKESLIFLEEKGLIRKEPRFGSKGERLANEYTLIIPQDYLEKSYKDYDETYKSDSPVDKTGGVGRNTPGGGSQYAGGVGRNTTPLNNKLLNNNLNKSFSNEKSKTQKAENEKKHDWAAMKNEAALIQQHEERKALECMGDRERAGDVTVAEYYLSNLKGIGKLKRYRNQTG